jgi:hypothetical protein
VKSIECVNSRVADEVRSALARSGVDLRRCIEQGPFQGSGPTVYVVINYDLDESTEATARQRVGRIVGATIQ